MKKRLCWLCAAVLLCAVTLVTGVSAASVLDEGTCGIRLKWTLYDDGELVIEGTGAMTDWASECDVPWYANRTAIKNVRFFEGITSIGSGAFLGCSNLSYASYTGESWEIDGVIIGSLSALDALFYIPDSVTTIGDFAFEGCTALTKVSIPNSVITIGVGAFYKCILLTDIEIGDSVKIIGNYAFASCTNLRKVEIPDCVSIIGEFAFRDCSQLTSVAIGNSVSIIDDGAFRDCCSLKSIAMGTSVSTISEGAFYNCESLISVIIPDSVSTIGYCSFANCDGLTSIILPPFVSKVERFAFANCSNLTNTTILSKTVSIDDYAFYKYNKRELTLNGYPGSTSEAYANNHSYITFVPLDETEPDIPGLMPWDKVGGKPVEDYTWDDYQNLTEFQKEAFKDAFVNANGFDLWWANNAPQTPAADVTFTLSDAAEKPGETVTVAISVSSTTNINSVALYELTYDEDILTFNGFDNYDEIEEKCFVAGFDDELGVITLALTETAPLNGTICDLTFTIKDGAADCTTEIGMTSLVKNNSDVISSNVVSGKVTVRNYITGDISDDGKVDILDALRLFQYSMLPDIYPVSYLGTMDFTGDALVNIEDALRLFQYSMLPDVYPLFPDKENDQDDSSSNASGYGFTIKALDPVKGTFTITPNHNGTLIITLANEDYSTVLTSKEYVVYEGTEIALNYPAGNGTIGSMELYLFVQLIDEDGVVYKRYGGIDLAR